MVKVDSFDYQFNRAPELRGVRMRTLCILREAEAMSLICKAQEEHKGNLYCIILVIIKLMVLSYKCKQKIKNASREHCTFGLIFDNGAYQWDIFLFFFILLKNSIYI